MATKSPNPEVCIYDYTRHPTVPDGDELSLPQLRLKGHTKGGFGLSWSTCKAGHLLSSADDGTVCLWDISAANTPGATLEAYRILTAHDGIVNDVSWHQLHPNIFGTVGDDMQLRIWDIRNAWDNKEAALSVHAHTDAVNCLAWNPYSEFALLTGSTDKTLALWDVRNLKEKLHTFESHKETVVQVEWSPHDEHYFASGSADRRINIWNLCKIGEKQSEEDAADGPPELLFVHGGHTAYVNDFSWDNNEPWMICSVADDNVLQVWKISEDIYIEDDEAIVSDGLENMEIEEAVKTSSATGG